MTRYSLIAAGNGLKLANLNIKYWGGPDYVICVGVDRIKGNILEWMKPFRLVEGRRARVSPEVLVRDLSYVARLYIQYPDIQIEKKFRMQEFKPKLTLARHVAHDTVGIYSPDYHSIVGVGGNYHNIRSINQVDFALERMEKFSAELSALQSALRIIGVEVEIL